MLAVVTGLTGFTGVAGRSSPPSTSLAEAAGTTAKAGGIVGHQWSTRDPHPKAPLSRTAANPPSCLVPASAARARKRQVLVVTANRTHAIVSGCTRAGRRYLRTLGPFKARVGVHGLAARGTKREGDGRTPVGVFPLRTGFGSKGNPGLSSAGFDWFAAGRSDVWVDDPGSKLYNTHQRRPARGRWRSAERLRIKPYAYAQVIGYNEAQIAGRGSAIFLHVGTGGPTAGCVSLSSAHLRSVMRWERTGAVIAVS